jgi:hypothetical protein
MGPRFVLRKSVGKLAAGSGVSKKFLVPNMLWLVDRALRRAMFLITRQSGQYEHRAAERSIHLNNPGFSAAR